MNKALTRTVFSAAIALSGCATTASMKPVVQRNTVPAAHVVHETSPAAKTSAPVTSPAQSESSAPQCPREPSGCTVTKAFMDRLVVLSNGGNVTEAECTFRRDRDGKIAWMTYGLKVTSKHGGKRSSVEGKCDSVTGADGCPTLVCDPQSEVTESLPAVKAYNSDHPKPH